MQLALADRSANRPEGEERDQCDSKDDCHQKNSAWSSAADSGDALANRLPLEHSDKHFFQDVEDQKQNRERYCLTQNRINQRPVFKPVTTDS